MDGDGRFSMVFPKPSEGLDEDFVAFLAAVAAIIPSMGVFVAGEFEGALHGLVGHPPVTAIDVEIVLTILKENTERFGFGFADEGRVVVTASKADVGADHGVDAAEVIGSFPGGGEGGDGAGGSSAEGAVIGVGGDVIFVGDEGDHFLDEEVGIVGAHAIVFERSVEAGLGVFVFGRSGDDAWVDEEADGDGHVSGGDELIEGVGNVSFFARVFHETGPVLEDHEAGGFGVVIFLGDVDPVIALGAGEDLGVLKMVFGKPAISREDLGDEDKEDEESHGGEFVWR